MSLYWLQLSLAEEYKKPIITVRYQHAEEMDPGLKLTIQRRQVHYDVTLHYYCMYIIIVDGFH